MTVRKGEVRLKRFLRNLLIYLIPFVLLFALFFAFEPYDYFELRGDATYLSKPLSSMRSVMVKKPANIILGDSRMANLNTDYIGELTGEDYTMLGFGGSNFGECIELFKFASKYTQIKKVYFGVSFYTVPGVQNEGRIPAVEKQAESTWSFVSLFNNWLEAVNTIKYKSKNLIGTVLNRPEMIEYPEDPTQFVRHEVSEERGTKYRKNLEEYGDLIGGVLGTYKIWDETYEQFEWLIDYCGQNGIELIFVIPPMHESVYELAIVPNRIEKVREDFYNWLKARATVYDLEFDNEFTRDENNFLDGFHLQGDKKQFLAELIFTNVDSPYIRRTYKN